MYNPFWTNHARCYVFNLSTVPYLLSPPGQCIASCKLLAVPHLLAPRSLCAWPVAREPGRRSWYMRHTFARVASEPVVRDVLNERRAVGGDCAFVMFLYINPFTLCNTHQRQLMGLRPIRLFFICQRRGKGVICIVFPNMQSDLCHAGQALMKAVGAFRCY